MKKSTKKLNLYFVEYQAGKHYTDRSGYVLAEGMDKIEKKYPNIRRVNPLYYENLCET